MNNHNSKKETHFDLLRILKLETTTPSGRINLAGVLILAIFCLLYTAGDAIIYFISTVSDTAKSIYLNQDIYHPYESTSVLKATLPILIGFVACLTYLYFDDKKRKKLQNEVPQKVENPIENL